MKPHTMLPGCNLFDAASARSVGVGAALHQRPPRVVASSGAPQPGGLLCTREDMENICPYDITQVKSSQVQEKLLELGEADQVIDWNDGQHFPWWVWLANTGWLRNVSNDGIYSVYLSMSNGRRRVVVVSVQGTYFISAGHNGNTNVSPTPRQY